MVGGFVEYMLVSISLYITGLRAPPSILIIGWWSSNSIAEARGSLGSVSKIAFATVSSPLI